MITRLVLENYRNIACCDVLLGPMTSLVGPNGAGKSNFMDALRFISDVLRHSLNHAVHERGGMTAVRRNGDERPSSFGIRLDFAVDDLRGHFAFEVGEDDGTTSAPRILREECVFTDADGKRWNYLMRNEVLESSNVDLSPVWGHDQFYLLRVANLPEFYPVYEALSKMGFYRFDPEVMRSHRTGDRGDLLQRNGANIAAVLRRIAEQRPQDREMIEQYLGAVVEEVAAVRIERYGVADRVEFRLRREGTKPPRWLDIACMSDGALGLLGVLTALFQRGDDSSGPRFIGIEEPENSLHPQAAAVLVDCLSDAAQDSQVLITTHSPDLFEGEAIPDHEILSVVSEDGVCRIGPMNGAARNAVGRNRYTVGELLRMDQLRPDPVPESESGERPALFGGTP